MSEQTAPKGRTKTLLVEFELPDFYAEDLPGAVTDWMREFGANPDDPAELAEEILRDSVRICSGYLIAEVAGEKDSEFVAVKVVARSARVEERQPTEIKEFGAWGRLAEHGVELLGWEAEHEDGRADHGLTPVPPANETESGSA